MHTRICAGVNVCLQQELVPVDAVGVVVGLGAAGQLEEVPGAGVGILLARRRIPERVEVHISDRLGDLVSHHAYHGIDGVVAVDGVGDADKRAKRCGIVNGMSFYGRAL